MGRTLRVAPTAGNELGAWAWPRCVNPNAARVISSTEPDLLQEKEYSDDGPVQTWHSVLSRLLRRVRLSECLAGGRGDLSPREYRRLQREAPEELRIEVLGVHERPIREREREFEVVVDAKILRINRTTARIHEGDVIKITYVRHHRERPLPGPGEPPLLERGKVYPAFLSKVERERIFKPAAGSFSFVLGGTAAVIGALRRIL